MQWILIALASLIGLVLLISIVGWMLPKGHVASRTARFAAPADQVYAVIADLEHTADWWPQIVAVERLADRGANAVWRQKMKHGTPLDLEVIEATPQQRFVTRIANDKLPFGGTWTYALTPDGDGCRVTVTENGEVYNPIFRFLSRFAFGYTATMESYLEALSDSFGHSVEFIA